MILFKLNRANLPWTRKRLHPWGLATHRLEEEVLRDPCKDFILLFHPGKTIDWNLSIVEKDPYPFWADNFGRFTVVPREEQEFIYPGPPQIGVLSGNYSALKLYLKKLQRRIKTGWSTLALAEELYNAIVKTVVKLEVGSRRRNALKEEGLTFIQDEVLDSLRSRFAGQSRPGSKIFKEDLLGGRPPIKVAQDEKVAFWKRDEESAARLKLRLEDADLGDAERWSLALGDVIVYLRCPFCKELKPVLLDSPLVSIEDYVGHLQRFHGEVARVERMFRKYSPRGLALAIARSLRHDMFVFLYRQWKLKDLEELVREDPYELVRKMKIKEKIEEKIRENREKLES